MTMKLIPTYRFDKYGYYCGQTRSMQDSVTGLITLPDDCVAFPPGDDELHWRISIDKTCWQRVQGVEEMALDELIAFCKDNTDRNAMIKSRILTEAARNSDYQVLKDNEYDCWYVVKRPNNPSLNELVALKKKFFDVINEIKRQFTGATILGDDQKKKALSFCYTTLLDADSVDDIKAGIELFENMELDYEHGESLINDAITAKSVTVLMEQDALKRGVELDKYVAALEVYADALSGREAKEV